MAASTLVGGAFLGGLFNVLLDRLSSPELIKFFRGRKDDERLLKKLNLKLLGLNKVLSDAEDKQYTDPAVKKWLDDLKGAIYDAEDLVDEIATAALRCKVEAEYLSRPDQVQSLISSFTKLFDDDIRSKLAGMIESLEDFTEAKGVLGLREVAGRNWSQPRLPTTSLVDESCVYGRENDKEELMKLLLSDGESSNKIDVIPIVGMGGVGKTTLAQLLYNDYILHGRFDKKAWVCVSDEFDVESITRNIVEAVNGQASDARDLNSLQVKLKESLSGKKFLIVLDDVWNENYSHWDVLYTPFKFGAHGSKIIVTTRNQSVAHIMKTVPIHELKELSNEDSWLLFSKHAFVNADYNAHPDLEQIGKKIVEKCKGLPLAAKSLGGLLRSQQDVKDWNSILESPIWLLPEEKSNILPALRLSYHYLPSHLKRCFAYCSIFVKDYRFNVDKLVSNWIAEGFLEKPKNDRTLGEEGYECFRELLSRSFFQKSSGNSFFVMHDLVHDLAQSMAGDICQRLGDSKPCNNLENVRHFSYVQDSFDGFDKFKVIKDAKCLRTFLQTDSIPNRLIFFFLDWPDQKFYLSKKVLDEILPGLARLRLLSLPRYQITELPHSIGKLIHLRFLDLSNTLIQCLPESVCTLYNLETLLLSNCHLLTTLPAKLVKLISLRHLDLTGSDLRKMPKHINRLKGLQQLTVFLVGKCSGSGINELKELHSLRGEITIAGLENVTSSKDASEAKLKEKKHLEKLALEWSDTAEDSQMVRDVQDPQMVSDVLEKLEPHTHLKHLHIKNYGSTKFPAWLGDQSFCKMQSLSLENIEFCSLLPPLGQLPALKELTISRMPCITEVGHEFYGEGVSLSKPFEFLETLRFEEMVRLVKWIQLDAGEFSRLQKLEVINCPNLIGDLPKKVPSLVGLKVVKCPVLVASLEMARRIWEVVLVESEGVQVETQGVSSVECLKISNFASLKELASELLTRTNLKRLEVLNCPRLLSLSEGMMHLNNLEKLDVRSCPKLKLPLSQEMSHCYKSLEYLILCRCESLKSLSLGLFPVLQHLSISDCINFETLVLQNLISYPNLASLGFDGCEKLKTLPEPMHTLLPSLQTLSLIRCPEIEFFPKEGLPTLPSKLEGLFIRDCKKLVGGLRDWGLQTLPSFARLLLESGPEDASESFPEEGLLPSTIKRLEIGDMPNLKSLNNKGLQLLSSLKYMRIGNCPQLQSLPEGLPTSLFALHIDNCPLLKPRCWGKEGEDWHKIARIPLVVVDKEAFFDQIYLGPLAPNLNYLNVPDC